MGINNWHVSERPREKLLEKGRQHLTESELLAILIGSGDSKNNALVLAREILSSCNDDLHALSRMDVNQLIRVKGVGNAKAIRIISAFELGRRRSSQEAGKKCSVTCSKDAADVLHPILADLSHEEFWVLYLNRANKIIKQQMISKGGIAGTVVDSRLIFKSALDSLSSSIILAHNHPSGNEKPSKADTELTQRLKEAGKFLEIPVLDHIILTSEAYFSFADEGLL